MTGAFQIWGFPRCGSTLLSLLLAAHSKIKTVGELSNYCCAQLDWRYWDAFKWYQDTNFNPMKKSLERNCVCWDCGADCECWKSLPRFKLEDLYAQVCFHMDSQWIVDASKMDWWNERICLETKTSQIVPILLHKPPWGVIASLSKHTARYPAITNWTKELVQEKTRYWGKVIIHAVGCLNRLGLPYYNLAYEELVEQPITVLKQIMARAGLEYESTQLEYWKKKHHRFGGNWAIKMDGIKIDEKLIQVPCDIKHACLEVPEVRKAMQLLGRKTDVN